MSGDVSRHDKPRERGGSEKTQNSLQELSGYTGIPPGKGWPPPETSLASSLVRAARSVDSQCQSRVIEPRNNDKSLESSRSHQRGQHRSAAVARRRGPTGVREQGKGTLGFPGNMGDPNTSLRPNAGMGEPAQQHPGLEAVGLPASRSLSAKPTRGIPAQCQWAERREKRGGSLSGVIVPQTKPANCDRRGSRGVGKGAAQ